ncbi:hypothetical protein [Glycomyces buryatensis]|uniref:Uncharacterized protein n=1 Tax=Glycomyces buryatensis TaxID=2570927 RepID=A0A4S8QAE2_9ACTN|nr:hypothetical protein [Glycomyces buryatensis]THV41453.1 hypothetical protein FAB82_11685 [Glycomyces buryatensis]
MSNPNQPQQPNDASPMTEEEQQKYNNMLWGGVALLVGPILVAMILSAADVDPSAIPSAGRNTVFAVLMIAGAGLLGSARRFKKDAKQRGGR